MATPPNSPDCFRLVIECWEKAKYDLAAYELNRMIEANPQIPDNTFTLAIVYLKLNRQEDALAVLRQCVDIESCGDVAPQPVVQIPVGDPDYQFARGFLHLETGDLEAAHTALQASLRARPGDHHTIYQLGRLFIEAGDQAAAREQYLKLSLLNEPLAKQLYDQIVF